jgi:ATP adenylyltransferase
VNQHDHNPVDPALSAHAALQAPWRLHYLEAIASEDKQPAPTTGCFIRDYYLAPERDAQNHVVVRTPHGIIFLNAFPYSNGHLLVAHKESRPRLLDYTPSERARLWQLTDAASELAELTLQPQGLNIGVNQGRAAGAGVPQHLHVHVIPRWTGDTNFITTVGRVRVIPAAIDAMYTRFCAAWRHLAPRWHEPLHEPADEPNDGPGNTPEQT